MWASASSPKASQGPPLLSLRLTTADEKLSLIMGEEDPREIISQTVFISALFRELELSSWQDRIVRILPPLSPFCTELPLPNHLSSLLSSSSSKKEAKEAKEEEIVRIAHVDSNSRVRGLGCTPPLAPESQNQSLTFRNSLSEPAPATAQKPGLGAPTSPLNQPESPGWSYLTWSPFPLFL